MHEQLVHYAQSFERIETFKSQMTLSYIEEQISSSSGEHDYGCGGPIDSNSEDHDEAVALRSPYLTVSCKDAHPVEKALSEANYASSGYLPQIHGTDWSFFDARNDVLNFLEPQYQRIAAAGREMAEFMKLSKREGDFLDPAGRETHGCCLETLTRALICLETYAKSFSRDIPENLQPRFRIWKQDLDLLYEKLPREWLLRCLDNWVKRFRHVKHEIYSQVELDQFEKFAIGN
jgi:hypothetical protein